MNIIVDLKKHLLRCHLTKLNDLYIEHNKEDDSITITNLSKEQRSITINRQFVLFKGEHVFHLINKGNLIKGQISFFVNSQLTFLNSETELLLSKLECLKIVITLKANTEVTINQIFYYIDKNSKFAKPVSTADTLVISPGYPNSSDLYCFGFVHTSTRTFVKHNIKTEVFCYHYNNSSISEFDGVKIYYNNLRFLKQLITNSNFKRIIIHFVGEHLQDIIDSTILYYGIKIYCYIHGAEILYRYQESFRTAYDGTYNPYVSTQQMRTKDMMYQKYTNNLNIKWIFVSNWMKLVSEKFINANFDNYSIIPNGIDTEIFKYMEKSANDRFNIFTLRKFDNYNNYALDIVIETILILQKKEFFNKLNFFIYGDGELFESFAEKIQAPNVHFIQGFYTHHQISELHKNCGIIFHPTRHDSMGVSSLEGVSSGLVLVSSNISAISEFIAPSYGTLSNDIENPESYANIIEDLFYNPDRFLKLSKQMSTDISTKYSRTSTVIKELQLYEEEQKFYVIPPLTQRQENLLSICIPAYNVEMYLVKCLNSILSCKNKHLLEILIINDGSTDGTQLIAEEYQSNFPSIIKLINQSNKGHGGAINTGIKYATSKYFKIIDGDDWVDPQELDNFLKYLNMYDVELIFNEFSYDILGDDTIREANCYKHLITKQVLMFDQIEFGFWGPALATSTYKTTILKQSNIVLPEKCFYVDMEYNAKAIQHVKYVVYLDIPLYRYYVGRPTQSISVAGFKIHDHEKIILSILNYLQVNNGTIYKQKLIMQKLLFPMLRSHMDRILQLTPFDSTHLKFFRKVKDNNMVNWSKSAFNLSKEIDDYLSNITVSTMKSKFHRYLSYIKLFTNKLLIMPYFLGVFVYKTLNAYDIHYFNKYAKIFATLLMLPKKIVTIFLKR